MPGAIEDGLLDPDFFNYRVRVVMLTTSTSGTTKMSMKLRRPLSVKQMVFGAIFFGFLAGFQTALGLAYLLKQRSDLRWLGCFAVAFGFCIVAAKYGIDLLKTRRIAQEVGPPSL